MAKSCQQCELTFQHLTWGVCLAGRGGGGTRWAPGVAGTAGPSTAPRARTCWSSGTGHEYPADTLRPGADIIHVSYKSRFLKTINRLQASVTA